MKTTLTDRTDTFVHLHVTLDETQLNHALNHVYDELRPRVKAAGFRPGKAPNMIVEREMGSGMIQSEVIEHAVQDAYGQAVREEKLQVVAPPKVSVEKFVPYTTLEFSAAVELMPKVTLPDYKSYRITPDAVTVDPAEIDQAVDELRRREASRNEVTRPAALGDEAVFDFTGTKDGAPVRGASAKNQTLQLGSGQFIPGFEDELVGLKPGEEKTFDITFPENYQEASLAGKVVTFAIKLHKLTELVLPPADNELAAKIGPFTSLKELKDDLGDQLAERKAQESSQAYEQKVLDQLIADMKTSVPSALTDQQMIRLKADMEQNLAYSGLTLDKYRELSGKTEEQLDTEMRPEAEKRVKLAMALSEIAEVEKIVISNDELDAEIERMRAQYKDPASKGELDTQDVRQEMYNQLMATRVISLLVEYASTDAKAKSEKKSNSST